MAQPNPRATARSVRAQADAVISACDAMERPPADVKVVAKMSAVAKEISGLLGRGIQPEELGHRAQAEAQSQLVRCERGLRSLRSTVSAASASVRRANRAGTEEDASELRSRAAAELGSKYVRRRRWGAETIGRGNGRSGSVGGRGEREVQQYWERRAEQLREREHRHTEQQQRQSRTSVFRAKYELLPRRLSRWVGFDQVDWEWEA